MNKCISNVYHVDGIDSSRPQRPIVAFLDFPGRIVQELFDILDAWRDRSAQRRHLQGLDDRLLRDIGLSRHDADIEVSKPFWRP